MPSWNIHTAHAELLLADGGAKAWGIQSVDAFLLGNLAPDIYVGYMVAHITRKMPYADTHLADPGFVPEPRYGEFFERYALPSADGAGHVSDVVLGAWTHLVADNVYNRHAYAFLHEHGIQPGEQARERKQGDFALFGRTLDIARSPEPTPEAIAQAAAFPQYPIAEADVRGACAAMARIVADNQAHHIAGTPAYDMLTESFFAVAFAEADALMRRGLGAYARGERDWGRA